MGVNFDEAILSSQMVDESFGLPVMHQALRIAMYDEYRAQAVYTKVIAEFGALAPFVNIVEAEGRHIEELSALFYKYGVEPVVNDWPKKALIEGSFVENCELGVAAEIDNIKMYDNLIPYAKQEDVLDAFFRLQAASFNNHLPAFRRCVASHYANMQAAREDSFETPKYDSFAQDAQKLFQSLGAATGSQIPDISALRSIVSGMGSEFILGAAAGVVIMGLVNQKTKN